MRALRVLSHEPGQVELTEVPEITRLGQGEVLVSTRAVGICGSDVHAWHATQTYAMEYPVTLGHEAMGVVSRLGPGVHAVAEGDRVVSETARSVCGTCRECREGHYNLCAQRQGFGARSDGAMAESFVTREQILHHVPANVSDEVAAATEPYCVAYNAVVERAHLRPGDVVTVIGPGPVGVFSAQIALLAGASTVELVGIEGDEARLQAAHELGVSVTLLATDTHWWREPRLATMSDVVIDASGVSASLEAALGLVRAGGQVVKVGWGPEPYDRPLDTLVSKAVDLHGAFSHTWLTWERVLRLIGERRLDPTPALHTFQLADWENAFTAMAERRVLKAVIII